MTDDMRKLIDKVKRLNREATRGWFARNDNGVWGDSPYVVNQQLLVFSLNPAYARDTARANVEMAALGRTAAPLLAAEVERLDAELDAMKQTAVSAMGLLKRAEGERDEALLTLAAEQGRQEGAPSKRWHYVGNEDGFDEERGEWRRRDGAVKVWWDNGRWIWGRRAQPGVYVAERGQPDDQPARAAMLAADAATG